MAAIRPIRAILFDLDGTLVDSEGQTDAAIASVIANVVGRADLPEGPKLPLPPHETRGRTWTDIVKALQARFPSLLLLDSAAVERDLVTSWAADVDGMVPIAGARDAVKNAAAAFPRAVAVVSSSPRAMIERLLLHIGVVDHIELVVGAEDIAEPKPAPACFLLAAKRLGVDPANTLVFEDSTAGLRAANAAGASSVAVLAKCAEREQCIALATTHIEDYRSLAPDYWAGLRR